MNQDLLEGVSRAWVGVVSKEHVEMAVQGSFAQVCAGKRGPLSRMRGGDLIVYYSPRVQMRAGDPVRAFTAIGILQGDRVYEFRMESGRTPWRRDVRFFEASPVKLRSLEDQLHFIRDNPNWGWLARRGLFEIDLEDARTIAHSMNAQERGLEMDCA